MKATAKPYCLAPVIVARVQVVPTVQSAVQTELKVAATLALDSEVLAA